MKVAFRVDGSTRLGLGHIRRCLSIADYLRRKKVISFFIISNNLTENLIQSNNYKVFHISTSSNEGKQIQQILSDEKCTILVIDSKRSSIKQIFNQLKKNIKIILIDNSKFIKYANFTILPGLESSLNHKHKNLLTGSKYVILGSNIKPKNKSIRKSHIFFSAGASDRYNITEKFIHAFRKSKFDFKLLVAIGKFYKHTEKLQSIIKNDKRIDLVIGQSNLVTLMSKCSLGVVTYGITAFEAAFAGLPIFILAHSNENVISAKKVAKYGWCKYVGKYDEINYNYVVKTIVHFSKDLKNLKSMSLAGKKFIDGNGAQRVANLILKL